MVYHNRGASLVTAGAKPPMREAAEETRQNEGAGWIVAIAATLGTSVSYVDRQTLAAVALTVRKSLAIDHTHFGWLVGAFSMAYLVGAPVAGIVIDRLGARRGFAIAVCVWSVVAAAHGLAISFLTLFFLRILLGLAEAPSFPAAAQAVRRALPAERRPAAYGILFTGSSIGAMIAAPLALGLEAHFGFRWAFVGTAAAGAVWIPFWLIATRGRLSTKESVAPPSAEAPLARPSIVAVATSAPVLRAIVSVLGSAPALMFIFNFTPQYLQETWHVERQSLGAWLVLPPLLFDIGAVGFGVLASRRPDRSTPKTLLLVSMALATVLAFAPLAPSPAAAMVLFGVASCGGGGLYAIVAGDMIGRVRFGSTSTASGLTAAAQSLAHIAAGPLVGFSVDRTHSYSIAVVCLGLAAVPSTLAFVLWPSLRKG